MDKDKDKVCTQCGNQTKYYAKGLCRPCYDAQPGRRAIQREWYKKFMTQTGSAAYQRAKSKKSRLRRHYGLTLAEYNALGELQSWCCGICSIHRSQLKRDLCVDHDHITGKIRALLCHSCNGAIGFISDDPIRAMRIIDYLELYKGEGND